MSNSINSADFNLLWGKLEDLQEDELRQDDATINGLVSSICLGNGLDSANVKPILKLLKVINKDQLGSDKVSELFTKIKENRLFSDFESGRGNTDVISTLEELIAGDNQDLVCKILDSSLVVTPKLFHQACKGKQYRVIEKMIALGVDINAPDENGDSPLVSACKGDREVLATLLVESFASLDIDEESYEKLLIFACIKGKVEALNILTESDEIQLGDDEFGGELLELAAMSGHDEIVKILMEKGVTAGKFPLDFSIALTNSLNRGHFNVAATLIEAGVDVNYEINGTRALNRACEDKNLEGCMMLVRNGAILDDVTEYLPSLLLYASTWGYEDVALKLLEHETDVNVSAPGGKNPLSYACSNGLVKLGEKLIEKGADINAGSDVGNDPLSAAIKGSQLDLFVMVASLPEKLSAQSLCNALVIAHQIKSRDAFLTVINMMNDYEKDFNQKSYNGTTPLMLLSTYPMDRFLAFQMERILAKPNLKDGTITDAFKYALKNDADNETLDLLFAKMKDRKIDVNNLDEEGSSALVLALNRAQATFANKLIIAGECDPNLTQNARALFSLMYRQDVMNSPELTEDEVELRNIAVELIESKKYEHLNFEGLKSLDLSKLEPTKEAIEIAEKVSFDEFKDEFLDVWSLTDKADNEDKNFKSWLDNDLPNWFSQDLTGSEVDTNNRNKFQEALKLMTVSLKGSSKKTVTDLISGNALGNVSEEDKLTASQLDITKVREGFLKSCKREAPQMEATLKKRLDSESEETLKIRWHLATKYKILMVKEFAEKSIDCNPTWTEIALDWKERLLAPDIKDLTELHKLRIHRSLRDFREQVFLKLQKDQWHTLNMARKTFGKKLGLDPKRAEERYAAKLEPEDQKAALDEFFSDYTYERVLNAARYHIETELLLGEQIDLLKGVAEKHYSKENNGEKIDPDELAGYVYENFMKRDENINKDRMTDEALKALLLELDIINF